MTDAADPTAYLDLNKLLGPDRDQHILDAITQALVFDVEVEALIANEDD